MYDVKSNYKYATKLIKNKLPANAIRAILRKLEMKSIGIKTVLQDRLLDYLESGYDNRIDDRVDKIYKLVLSEYRPDYQTRKHFAKERQYPGNFYSRDRDQESFRKSTSSWRANQPEYDSRTGSNDQDSLDAKDRKDRFYNNKTSHLEDNSKNYNTLHHDSTNNNANYGSSSSSSNLISSTTGSNNNNYRSSTSHANYGQAHSTSHHQYNVAQSHNGSHSSENFSRNNDLPDKIQSSFKSFSMEKPQSRVTKHTNAEDPNSLVNQTKPNISFKIKNGYKSSKLELQSNLEQEPSIANLSEAQKTSLQIKLKKTPFYNLVKPLTEPLVIPSSKNEKQKFTLRFTLTEDDVRLVRSMRYRIYLLSILNDGTKDHSSEVGLDFPQGTSLLVNNHTVNISISGIRGKRGVSNPCDITKQVSLEHKIANLLEFSLFGVNSSPVKIFAYLVIPQSNIKLINEIVARPKISYDETLTKFFKKDDDELCIQETLLTLKCPIAFTRIEIPIQGKNCGHVECIDANNYLLLQRQAESWTCPICNNSLAYEDITVCEYMKDILQKTKDYDLDAILLESDGTWCLPKNAQLIDDSKNDTVDEEDDKDVLNVMHKKSFSMNEVVSLIDSDNESQDNHNIELNSNSEQSQTTKTLEKSVELTKCQKVAAQTSKSIHVHRDKITDQYSAPNSGSTEMTPAVPPATTELPQEFVKSASSVKLPLPKVRNSTKSISTTVSPHGSFQSLNFFSEGNKDFSGTSYKESTSGVKFSNSIEASSLSDISNRSEEKVQSIVLKEPLPKTALFDSQGKLSLEHTSKSNQGEPQENREENNETLLFNNLPSWETSILSHARFNDQAKSNFTLSPVSKKPQKGSVNIKKPLISGYPTAVLDSLNSSIINSTQEDENLDSKKDGAYLLNVSSGSIVAETEFIKPKANLPLNKQTSQSKLPTPPSTFETSKTADESLPLSKNGSLEVLQTNNHVLTNNYTDSIVVKEPGSILNKGVTNISETPIKSTELNQNIKTAVPKIHGFKSIPLAPSNKLAQTSSTKRAAQVFSSLSTEKSFDSAVGSKRTYDVIDLTLSDEDEEPPLKR